MYVIAGFLGSAVSYAFGDFLGGSLGASGAIFGIAGVLLVYLFRRRSSTFVYAEMRSVMLFVGLNLVLGFSIRGIDYWAHIGGLLAGMGLAVGFDRGESRPPSVAAELAAASLVVGVGIALVAYRTATYTPPGPFGL